MDEFHAGVDGIFNGLNTLPAIITPMLKEGFAEAGLDLDVTVDVVVGSMVFNYVGTPENVTNDLFLSIPYAKDDLNSIRPVQTDLNRGEMLYDLSGKRMKEISRRDIFINNGQKQYIR